MFPLKDETCVRENLISGQRVEGDTRQGKVIEKK